MKTLIRPYGQKNYGALFFENGRNFFQLINKPINKSKSALYKYCLAMANDLVNKHVNVWNEPDADKRNMLIAELYTADFLFTDPNFSIIGHDMLGRHIENFQKEMPQSFFFIEDKSIIIENDIVSFRWQLRDFSSQILFSGLDAISVKNGLIDSLDVYLDQ